MSGTARAAASRSFPVSGGISITTTAVMATSDRVMRGAIALLRTSCGRRGTGSQARVTRACGRFSDLRNTSRLLHALVRRRYGDARICGEPLLRRWNIVLGHDHRAPSACLLPVLSEPATARPNRARRKRRDDGRKQLDGLRSEAATRIAEVLTPCFLARGRESEHLRRSNGRGELQYLVGDRQRLVQVLVCGSSTLPSTTRKTTLSLKPGWALGQRSACVSPVLEPLIRFTPCPRAPGARGRG